MASCYDWLCRWMAISDWLCVYCDAKTHSTLNKHKKSVSNQIRQMSPCIAQAKTLHNNTVIELLKPTSWDISVWGTAHIWAKIRSVTQTWVGSWSVELKMNSGKESARRDYVRSCPFWENLETWIHWYNLHIILNSMALVSEHLIP